MNDITETPLGSVPDTRMKPGPVPRLETRLTSVMLEPDLIEWAKLQPGGLSETVRHLLREAMERERSIDSE